ncbi:hypothetical protein [Sporomusa sphaeroides]|uniref:hypothetical protein n=1 Tax=Sporomusa sphaeroides TaxID=47679 RepID=UPI002BA22185|nr:hypothetical protein [Sporomusa sphaeroides]HML32300.1 hypothetical protein [Sporomusa sphaeroides]
MLIILLAEMSDEHQRIRTRGRSETTEMTRSDIFLTVLAMVWVASMLAPVSGVIPGFVHIIAEIYDKVVNFAIIDERVVTV